MDPSHLKNYGWWALVALTVYSLLKLNLFVTQAQLEQQLRLMETQNRAEYATKQDILDIKARISTINEKLDKMYEKIN